MAHRAVCNDVALTRVGIAVNIEPNAEITVYNAGTNDPYIGTIYSSHDGAGTLPNPFFADENGNFTFFLESAITVKLSYTGTGLGTIVHDYVPVMPSSMESFLVTGINDVLDGPVVFDLWYDKGSFVNDIRAFAKSLGKVITNASLQGATGTAVLTGNAVSSVTVTAPGHYLYSPYVTFSGGGGTGAAGTAVLSGDGVVSVTITNGGSGYTSPPTVYFQQVWYTNPTLLADNTTAIQAAINACTGGVDGTRSLYIPAGVIQTNELDVTDFQGGVAFISNGGRLMPGPAVDGKVWIDCTGSAAIGFYNIELGDTAMPCIPTVGVLYANSTAGNASNVHWGFTWRMQGFYSIAAVVGLAFNSSQFFNSSWANSISNPGVPAAAFRFDALNKTGLTSAFTTLDPTYAGCTTISFFGCEFHGEGSVASHVGDGTQSNYAIRASNASGIRLHGCHASSNLYAPSQILLETDKINAGAPGSNDWWDFLNTHLYTEGPTLPQYSIIITNPDDATLDGSVKNLVVQGGVLACTVAPFKFDNGLTIRNLTIPTQVVEGGATSFIVMASGSATLINPAISDANALPVNVGSGAIQGGFIYNVGTLTHGGSTTVVSTNTSHVMTRRTPILLPNGSVSAPSLGYSTVPGMGTYLKGSDWFGWSTSSAIDAMDLANGILTLKDYLVMGEATPGTPATPAANKTALYAGTDGKIYVVRNAGDHYPLIDANLLTAAGDMIYAAGDENAAKLAIGTTGDKLEVVSGLPVWKSQYIFNLTHNVNQSIPASTIQPLAFNTEHSDSNGMHDTTTNNSRVTIPSGAAGIYLVGGAVRWANPVIATSLILQIRVTNTGNTFAESTLNVGAGVGAGMFAFGVVALNVSDYLEFVVTHFDSGALNINSAANVSPNFFGFRIGRQ